MPYEPLQPGPNGRRLAVIDYDVTNNCYYHPVDLEHPSVLIRGGMDPSESDPRFHQQMVYAVASETVWRFECALGRPMRWRSKAFAGEDDLLRDRLRVFPHAFEGANAFYDLITKLTAQLFDKAFFRPASVHIVKLCGAEPESAGMKEALSNAMLNSILLEDPNLHR